MSIVDFWSVEISILLVSWIVIGVRRKYNILCMDSGKQKTISFIGVVLMAILLPSVLKLANSTVRLWAGAEGRLAAIAVETNHVLGPLPKPWLALAQGGENLQGFLDNKTKRVGAMKPEYIRIDHVFDQFDVVYKDGETIKYNWAKLDKVLLQIKETGATPFISLSYMPEVLATTDIISEPKDWNQWANLVKDTIEHISGTLDFEDVYYEVWNEPDLFGGWKMGGKKDYRTLYLYSARGAVAAKNVNNFKLGGPGTTGLYKNWMDQFFPYILQNNLRFDFFSWHRYDLDIAKYNQDVAQVDAWLEKHPYFTNVEKIVTEFGPKSDAGGANDTKMGAAHLVAVMRELTYKIKYGFTFSVDGAWGVLDKPREQALLMLTRLGDKRLGVSGEGSWVRAIGAQKDNVYQVLVANYDPRGTHFEDVPITFVNLKERDFIIREKFLGGGGRNVEVATTEAILQHTLPMTPNSVILVELEPKKN